MSVIALFKDFFAGRERVPTDAELSDMGMSRLDYNQLIRSKDGTRERMEVLAARFGVTSEMIDADHGLALELARTCGACPNTKLCQNAIDLGVDMDTRHCPNAAVYADMSPA